MMKIIVALCVVFALAQAAHQTYWYSGSVNTTGTPYANPVDVGESPCTTLAGQSGYRNFTVNVTTAGFFYFTALFERTFKNSAQVQVYANTFNPANACANLLIAVSGQSSVPHIEFVQYFTAGLYQVVVTGSNNASLGLFSIHVDVATLNGATDELTSNWWITPSSQSSDDRNICEDGSYKAPYTSFSFYQNGTASTDILVFGYNSTTTSTFDISAALYNTGSLNFTGQGNFSNPVSGCTTPNFVYGWGSTFSDLGFSLQGTLNYEAAAAVAVTLNNGTTYSIIASSYISSNAYTSKFGVFMRPTLLSVLTNRTFTGAPSVTADDCTPTSRDVYFGINIFTAQYSAYILDNARSGFFDASGCLYSGINNGDGVSSPLNCPGNTSTIGFIQCGDTGDGGPVASFLTVGGNYTWINYQYSGTGTPGAPYLLYTYSGTQLGSGPITTTAAATTAAATTASMEGSSSSASTIVVMFSLYIAAMFF